MFFLIKNIVMYGLFPAWENLLAHARVTQLKIQLSRGHSVLAEDEEMTRVKRKI